jgi:hypothetical protein
MTEVPTVERKQCSKCHIEKPSNEFDRYKRTADGLQSQCKSCMKVSSHSCATSGCLLQKQRQLLPKGHAVGGHCCAAPYNDASFDCRASLCCFLFLQNARTMVAEPTVLQKRCTKCRVTKAASEFFRFKFSSDGLQSYCKVTACPVDPLILARIPYVTSSVRMLHCDNGTCVNWNLFQYSMKACC